MLRLYAEMHCNAESMFRVAVCYVGTQGLFCMPRVLLCAVICWFVCTQGLMPDASERLPHWSFHDATITVQDRYNLKAAVFITTLSQLEQLHTTGNSVVELTGWQWSDESLRVLAASLPALQHLQLSVAVTLDQPLTDELLGVVLQLGTRVRKLAVDSLALQSDQHSSAVWPWQSLTVDSLDVSQLALLPCPEGGKTGRQVVQCENIRLDDTVTKVRSVLCWRAVCTIHPITHVPCAHSQWIPFALPSLIIAATKLPTSATLICILVCSVSLRRWVVRG